MKTTTLLRLGLTALGLAGLFSGAAEAQAPHRGNLPRVANHGRPGLSPYGRPHFGAYLNLLRGGNPVFNYHGIVRPELEFRAAEQRFQGNFRQLEGRLDRIRRGEEARQMGSSGHQVRFGSDLRGGSGKIGSRLQQRRAAPSGQAGSRMPQTGHSAYFGNRHSYYRQR